MKILLIALPVILLACNPRPGGQEQVVDNPFVIFDNRALDLIDTTARLEELSCGYEWTEGPLWIEAGSYLIFSDIPTNTIYAYYENGETSVFLSPSGYTGDTTLAHQPGSNGLILDKSGNLILLQQGDRRLAKMQSSLDDPRPVFKTIADRFDHKRLNSPNDAVIDSLGNIYFTDPTYGLAGGDKDPARELAFHGVFCAMVSGELLLLDTLDRPNGIALSPGQDKLYVSCSNWENPQWYQYDVLAPGRISERKLFFETKPLVGSTNAADGMAVAKSGLVFTSGPGGAWLLSADGKALARLKVPSLVSNCTFDAKEEYLYLTADDCLVRIRLKN